MKIIKTKVSFKDKRGEIIDILQNTSVNAVTLITSKRGSIRANHYHKRTIQYNYILSGKIKFITQLPKQENREFIGRKGDTVVIFPKERHTLIAIEDFLLLVITKGPRGGKEYESDTFRLPTPLVDKINKRKR